MEFLEQVALKRYSCRAFSEKELTSEQMQRIVRAAMSAPSACNLKPWHLYIVEGESLRSLEKLRSWFGAQCVIIGCTKQSEAWVRQCDSQNFAKVDLSLAMMQACDEATALGISSCFIASFTPKVIAEFCSCPEEETPCMALALGYSKEALHPAKDISDEDIDRFISVL